MIAFAKNSDIQKWFEAKNMSRSNSTQNKVFNDLPEKDQKDIIRGAMDYAKRKQDEVLDAKKQISNEVDVATDGKDIRIEDSTQNDWAEDLDYIDFVTPEDMDRCVVLFRNLLADARREVIDRIESEGVVNRAWIKIDSNEFILIGKEFLATLREEEGAVK